MAICAKCCEKNFKHTKRKCDSCGKIFTKYVARVQDPSTRRWRTKTVSSLKLAKEIEAKFKTDLVEGHLFNKKQVGTIDFDKYLEYARLHKITWKMDQSRWENHIKGHDYLSKKGISCILSHMKKDGYADGTIHHVLKLIKRVFNWSIENGYYHEINPCNFIKPPKYDNRVTDYFSTEEIKDLFNYLDTWDNHRASNIIKFAFFTGRRKREITNLTWESIDFQQKCMTCNKTKNGLNQVFPLNNSALGIIQDAYNNRISDFVFPSSTGHDYYNGFSLCWARLKKRLGIKYRFHSIRHSYGSNLASSGKCDLLTLKSLLGHQDIKMTQRYAHLTNDAIKKANNLIDEIL